MPLKVGETRKERTMGVAYPIGTRTVADLIRDTEGGADNPPRQIQTGILFARVNVRNHWGAAETQTAEEFNRRLCIPGCISW